MVVRHVVMRLTGFVLLLVLLCNTGCNVASTAAYILSPNPVVKAKHTLVNEPTVVFLDDRHNRVNPVRYRRVITDTISEDLLAEELISDVISPRDATAAARQLDRGPRAAGVNFVGELVGANQVIYVEMIQFRLSRDGLTPEPYAACRIRVIDVVDAKRVFPDPDDDDLEAFLLEVTLPAQKSQGLTESRTRQQLSEMLAVETGNKITQLFYDHEITEVGTNLIYR